MKTYTVEQIKKAAEYLCGDVTPKIQYPQRFIEVLELQTSAEKSEKPLKEKARDLEKSISAMVHEFQKENNLAGVDCRVNEVSLLSKKAVGERYTPVGYETEIKIRL